MKMKQPMQNRSGQRGQAVLWFLATVAACCAMLAVVYNVGQVTNEKEKTVNAADAAALSGALAEARMLNFEAYTNRAMIANEVTIAQLVSADSWVRYDATMAQYLDDYLQVLAVIPIIGSAIVTTLDTYAEGMQILQEDVMDPAAETFIPLCDAAITALKTAREGVYYAAPLAADSVASGVANANTTTFGGRTDATPELNPAFQTAFLLKNTSDWLNFTQSYDGDQRVNARDVILNSRDQFSIARGAGPLIDTIDTALEIGGLIQSGGTQYYGFDKTSTETKLKDFDHWEAQDTLDPFRANIELCFGFIPCGYLKTYLPAPLAYGRVDADSDGSVGDSMGRDLCHPSGLSLNGLIGTTLNCVEAAQSSNVINSNGIPNIRDVATQGSNPTLTYVAGVQKAGDATLTTQRIGSPGMNTTHLAGPEGSPDVKDNLQNGDRLTSISSALVFFARPDWNPQDKTEGDLPRIDHVHEYASLYNPYWQARLTPTDDTTKAVFYGLIGSNPLLSPITP
jgi:Putative Flp pilus-assembly TadE/G-like